jgi:hypothetical protein
VKTLSKVRKNIKCEILFPLIQTSPMCIEFISAVKHLKGSEVAPRGLFQGFLQIRRNKMTIQNLQLPEDLITPLLSLPSKTRHETGF